jgi:hypothetical protein
MFVYFALVPLSCLHSMVVGQRGNFPPCIYKLNENQWIPVGCLRNVYGTLGRRAVMDCKIQKWWKLKTDVKQHNRFVQVSSWVTHLIITQPTHDDRKAVLSCILRVALSCWNIGNFNGAMEIVAGLKWVTNCMMWCFSACVLLVCHSLCCCRLVNLKPSAILVSACKITWRK